MPSWLSKWESMTYRYFALPDDAVSGTGEIRRGMEDRFFEIAQKSTGLTRAELAASLHAGRKIERGGFRLWAEPINPFKPAKIGGLAW